MRPEENPPLSKRVGNVVCERDGVAGIRRSPDACFGCWMAVAWIILCFACPLIKPFARNLITVFSTVNTSGRISSRGDSSGNGRESIRETRMEAAE